MSNLLATSIKTPSRLRPVFGEFTPLKSTITKTVTISGQKIICFQVDTSHLTQEKIAQLGDPEKIKKQGFFIPAYKNVSLFGVPD